MDRNEKIAVAMLGVVVAFNIHKNYVIWKRLRLLEQVVDVVTDAMDAEFQQQVNARFEQIIEENGLD